VRTVVQISDLHFGAILRPTLDVLHAFLHELKPDLLIVSGDLTQRAVHSQFVEADAYLQSLPKPQVVIPGNHDISLYNVFRRFFTPLDEYERCISTNHAPVYVDDEIAVVGLNSARSFTFKGGSLNSQQIADGVAHFKALRGHQVRIVFTHHPFDIPVALSGVNIIGNARDAVQAFAEQKVDLFLTGHLHLVHRAKVSEYAPDCGGTLLGAGTATSKRARGEPNSFYVFRIDHTRNDEGAIAVETHTWNAARNVFEVTDTRGLPRVSSHAALDQGHGSGITA
jgi:3',5'-cyclic AMP phosphodiesterase CpdA